jgi:hypothetical protein
MRPEARDAGRSHAKYTTVATTSTEIGPKGATTLRNTLRDREAGLRPPAR